MDFYPQHCFCNWRSNYGLAQDGFACWKREERSCSWYGLNSQVGWVWYFLKLDSLIFWHSTTAQSPVQQEVGPRKEANVHNHNAEKVKGRTGAVVEEEWKVQWWMEFQFIRWFEMLPTTCSFHIWFPVSFSSAKTMRVDIVYFCNRPRCWSWSWTLRPNM